MNIHDTLTLTILDVNENGMGIARHDGMVIFVPGLLPGESAEVEIQSLQKNYAIGRILAQNTHSPFRIDSVCSSFPVCGGCTLPFVSYPEENRIKKGTVQAALRRVSLPYDLVTETIFPTDRTGYRNKIVVHFNDDTQAFGYRKEHSIEGIPFDSCHLCPDIINRLIRFINETMTADFLPLQPSSLQIRTSSDGLTISVYGTGYKKTYIKAIQDRLTQTFPEIHEVLFLDSRHPAPEKVYIHDDIHGLHMRFTSEAFRQVNPLAFEQLLCLVEQLAGQKSFSCGADLYCGSGIIGLSLAKYFPQASFWGIEINPDAVSDAIFNAAENKLRNITFFCGDAAAFRQKISGKENPDLIVVDPPRAGLSSKMRRDLLYMHPDRIIYVSCNPQTMARDLSDLVTEYSISRITPVNMFPMTKHVETVALLSRDPI